AAPAPDTPYSLLLYGAPIQEAAQHLQLVRGRLPQAQSSLLEIAITQQSATYLHVDVGAKMAVKLYFVNLGSNNPADQELLVQEPVQVSGIITSNPGDPFWHNQDFDSRPGPLGAPSSEYTALMSDDGFLNQMQQLVDTHVVQAGTPFLSGGEPTLYWYYHLNASVIGIPQLDDLIARLQAAPLVLEESLIGSITNIQFSSPVVSNPPGTGALEQFRSRLSVINIPVTLLLLQVAGLILFFVGLMASLLVERQADVIALLRSRGASARQIFGSFAAQGVGLALLAALVGPWLALLTTGLLVKATLGSADQQAQNVIAQHPLPSALPVVAYALVAAVCAVGAMLLAIWRSTSRDVLALRRETARATRQPFWQRLYLDVVAVIIALTGFVFSLYVSNAGAADAQTITVISNPLALVAPIFLVIAGLLLFLRFFPRLLRRMARVTSRRPAAAPMLAVAQMARAPRLAVQMILLLALASGYASFALVFITSESQHLQAFAAYEAGADFSGAPVTEGNVNALANQTAAYQAIPGVTSATLGHVSGGYDVAALFPVSILAVDTDTFAQTAIWTSQDSSQPLSALMQPLIAARSSALTTQIIPAVVDQLTWQRLHLQTGALFVLRVDGVQFLFRATAEITHLPTVEDSLNAGNDSTYTAPGGILIDYQSLAAVYAPTGVLPVDYVWLRTSDDPAALAKIRRALTGGPLALSPLNDRRANLSALETDPLYLTLQGVLLLGTATTILLALVGNLIASWLSARTRLLHFAVLRALGTTPGQLASVLTWEQVIVYATAIVLGACLGAGLSGAIVPALIFTGLPNYMGNTSSGEFYALQHLLPSQIVVPGLLILVFVALVVICALAIGLMARVISRPALGQTLRLNAD
ncbi:MAG TPA: FtsX-like permease family protein, partial [Ktedonobacterales bacterium]